MVKIEFEKEIACLHKDMENLHLENAYLRGQIKTFKYMFNKQNSWDFTSSEEVEDLQDNL